MKRLLAILAVTLVLAVSVLAQDSTPNWPPEWFGSSYEFPPIPSGTYLVTVRYPGIGSSEVQQSLATGSAAGPEGAFCLDGTCYSVFGTTVGCTDASCSTLAIQVVTVSGTGDTTYFTILLTWSAYSTAIPGTPTPPGTATTIPGTATPLPTATPEPDDVTCPSAVITQQNPRVEVVRTFPPNPVVVTQGGQGLQVTVRVTSFPVIRTYWEKVDYSRDACVHTETGTEDTGQYGVSPCAAGWEGWEMRHITDIRCEQRTQIIPDPVVPGAFRVHARLRERSKQWIEGELQQRYPGARVKRPNWDEAGQVTANGCLGDGRCILEVALRFMFVDPGYYDMWADGTTAGTLYTLPRPFRYNFPRPQPVYLIDSTLIPDW